MAGSMYIPLGEYIDSLWPKNILEPPPVDQIKDVWIEPLRIETEPSLTIRTAILFEAELALAIPGVDGVSLVCAAAGNDTAFMFEVVTDPAPAIKVVDIPIAIRFAKDLLKPAALDTDAQGNQSVRLDPTQDHVDITLAKITLTADFDGAFAIDVEGGIDLPLCLIGDTGVGVEARGIRFVGASDPPPPGRPAGWSGIYIPSAGLWLPRELGGIVGHLTLTDATIGNGGFSGTLTDTWTPPLATSLGGLELTLESVALSLVQNTFTQCEILGTIKLPFFDAPLAVDIGINLDGSLAITLAAPGGLVTLNKPGILELEVHSLGFAWDGATATVKLSGKIRPLVGGLDWPAFDVKELSIDSHGNVKVDGGWIDLRDGYSLDFHGFKVEITKIGFGKNDDGGKWIGFSGALNLVDGFQAGASVEGLKVTWYEDGSHDPKISLDGVGVEMEIPSTLSFKGHVSYHELVDSQGAAVHQFDGDITLKLLALDLEIDGVLVIGSARKPAGGSFNFFAIYLATDLPAGIPLWSTGLALYGFAGLFALQMEPDKHTDEEWYGVGPSDGWYKRPAIGVTDLSKKWRGQDDSRALGGGLSIGTLADNGFAFSGRTVLVLVFPGPIIMVEGRANLLKERSQLTKEPLFRALAVLDERAGTLLFGLDARYKAGSNGELIDISGSAEAFFDFHDFDRWHLYLGLKDPREKRIRARLFKLFESNSYLMIDAHALQVGAWVGFNKNWHAGPVKITLEAWLEANAAVNRKPVHFHGDLWAHGKVSMRVFGFGFGLSLDAKIAGDVFDPFHILAELAVTLDLPWPIPNVHVHTSLEWGPEPTPPPIPMVLKELAIEHFKVTTTWPLPRASLLLPDFDRDGFIGPPLGPSIPADLNSLPVVPLDCRPHITFGRPVHDAALVGNNPQPPDPPEERIGDPSTGQGPARIKYLLRSVTLEKLAAGSWTAVARKADTPNPPGLPELFASWAPVPAEPGPGGTPSVGQVKLWIWSKNAFDYTRVTSGSWDEWFTGQFTTYPCIPDASGKTICCDFTRYPIGSSISLPHACDSDMFLAGVLLGGKIVVNRLRPPIEGIDRAAFFPLESFLEVQLTRPARHVDILLAGAGDSDVTAIATLNDGSTLPAVPSQNGRITIGHEGLKTAVVRGKTTFLVVRVCTEFGPDPDDVLVRQEMAQHLQSATALWNQVGAVLEPDTIYRLKILTRAEATGEEELAGWSNTLEQEEIGYFRTSGPPGLTRLSVPVNQPNPGQFDSGLTDLARYVAQTIPPTVPPPGQKPALPRPVYRAYDVGVAFNEDYVDLLYRISGRDLGLYLFDNNNTPVRDASGRLIARPNEWGNVETLTLAASDQRWIQIVNESTCAFIDVASVPHDVTLTAASVEQVLAPDALHEARLVPLLLHEGFRKLNVGDAAIGPAGLLGRWQVVDQATAEGPSRWLIAETPAPVTRYVVQTTNIGGGTPDANDLQKPGSMLVLGNDPRLPADDPDQPGFWTDYRLTVFVRNEDNEAIGVVFRYADANNYYRFSMDAKRQYRRLVRVIDGAHTLLGEDDRRYRPNVDYGVTVEAIGTALKVYVDGESILEASDDAHPAGSVGLYCWASQNARFFDIAIDDFRKLDPAANRLAAVYRFQFATSKFAHFTHHVHSFDDRVYQGVLDPSADAAAWIALAVVPDATITDDESRAYDALARAVLGTGADGFPKSLEFTRVEQNASTIGFLAQTSEPFDWARLDVRLSSALQSANLPISVPGVLKMTSVTFAQNLPSEESVTLVTRDSLDLRGHALETLLVPGPIEATAPVQYLLEDFDQAGLGLQFTESFGPSALDRYTIVDQGPLSGPSAWSSSAVAIRQTSKIGGDVSGGNAIAQPGTMAITGDPSWADVRINARLLSTDTGAIGIVFRYRDPENYYRFSADNEQNLRRLVKCVAGAVTLLWEDGTSSYEPNVAFELQFDLFGNRLLGLLDNIVLFDVTDDSLKMGQVGLYSWMNAGSEFQDLRVRSLDRDPVLLRPAPDTLDGWLVLDPEGAIDGPSVWSASASGFVQSSHISVPGPEKLGAHLVTSRQWGGMQLSLALEPTEDGAIGVLIRYLDKQNYYRFSMSRAESYRRLEKRVDGAMSVLWQDATPFELGHVIRLSVRAKGGLILGFLDGQQLFSVIDHDISSGGVGLYTWGNGGTLFEEPRVLDPVDYVGSFQIVDGEGLTGTSAWRTRFGTLEQRSDIGDSAAPHTGTHAVASVQVPPIMRLVVDARSDGEAPIGVLFRYQDERHYYRLSVSTADAMRQLLKVFDGAQTVLWQAAGGYSPESAHRFTVDTFGDRLVGYFDGERLFDVRDSSLAAGTIGLYVSRNDSAAFDRVEVTTPPIEANALFVDKFAENDVTDWTFISEATVGLPPQWAATEGILEQTSMAHSPLPAPDGDLERGIFAVAGEAAWGDVILRARLQSVEEGAIGVMFRYQDQDHYYRFSMDGARKYRRLVKNVGGTLMLLWQDDFAIELGHAYEIVIVAAGSQIWSYFDGVPMFSIADPDVAHGRVGLYCWRNPGARFSCVAVLPIEAAFTAWAFKDNFPYLVVDRWKFVDVGAVDAPSNWTVSDGRLLQTSPISGGSARAGTYAVSATGSRDWPDYRITVLVASSSPSADGVIGLAARYQDPDNHYRFEIGFGSGIRRLVKVVAGEETELWSESTGDQTNAEPLMAGLECVGRRIRCFVNGVRLCEVVDDAFSRGRVALFTFKDPGGEFGFVRVQEAAWQSYYRFGKAATRPAGHRIRVLACPESAAPQSLPNVQDVFIANLGERGDVHFLGSSCDLRIVDPLGRVQHTRTFLHPSQYVPVAGFKVLRRADRCGFFAALPADLPEGSQLPRAEYRLELAYRRDNTAADPTSPVQREAGVSDPEATAVDLLS
jgi:hypothetical protein